MLFSDIPHEIYIDYILPYVIRPPMKLLDWIDIDRLNWSILSAKPNAIDLLKNNMDKIDWSRLSANENAIDLLKNNMDKIDWQRLSANENAIDLLKEHIDKIDWMFLSMNPNAIELLEKESQNEINRMDWIFF